MDRRQFLTSAGLVGVGAATASGIDAAGGPASLPATARTARPAGRRTAYETRVIFRTAPARRLVAITFDDGPTPAWTPRVLELLSEHRALATFFLVGERLRAHPELAVAAAAAGHQLGNHTWAHSDLTAHRAPFIAESVRRTHDLIVEVTGVAPRVLRPPWGRIDSVGLAACAEMHYDVVLWSDHVTGASADADVDATLRQVSPGSIVLAHDGGREPNRHLVRALDRLLTSMSHAGYELVRVSDLLAAAQVGPLL